MHMTYQTNQVAVKSYAIIFLLHAPQNIMVVDFQCVQFSFSKHLRGRRLFIFEAQ